MRHCYVTACVMGFVLFSMVTLSSQARCTGKWAIHACIGGNGKRSEMSANNADTAQTALLPYIVERLQLLQQQNKARRGSSPDGSRQRSYEAGDVTHSRLQRLENLARMRLPQRKRFFKDEPLF